VVFLMQENHTFDNYFSAFPGVDQPPGPMPAQLDPDADPKPEPQSEPDAKPKPVGELEPSGPRKSRSPTPAPTPAADADPQPNAVEHPATIGSTCRATERSTSTTAPTPPCGPSTAARWTASRLRRRTYNLPTNLAMGYYDGTDLPLYYNLASDYVLAQRFFSSAWGSSEINHMYSQSQPAAADAARNRLRLPDDLRSPPGGRSVVEVLRPELRPDDHLPQPRPQQQAKAAQLIWAPLLDFARFVDDPALSSHIVDMSQYYTDLQTASCRPWPTWSRAACRSIHPEISPSASPSAVTTITSLMRSSSLGQQRLHPHLGRLGRLVRPCRPAASRRRRLRLPRAGDHRLAVRPPVGHDRQHDLRLHVSLEVHRGQLVAAAADRRATRLPTASPTPSTSASRRRPHLPGADISGTATRHHNRPLLLAIYAAVVAFAIICGALILYPALATPGAPASVRPT
jgi:hypothetical protein